MTTRQKIITGAGAVLLVVFGAAVAVRCLATPAFSEDLYQQIVGLGQRVRPNLESVEVVIPGRPHPLPFQPRSEKYTQRISRRVTYRCSTNAFGHRNGPVSGRPIPGTTRIICFGDGVTFGHGVDQGLDYPAQLQKELASRGKFEVINAGNPREKADHGVKVLERLIVPLQPAVVILDLGVNTLSGAFKAGDNETIYYPAEYENIGHVLEHSLRQMITLLQRKKIRVALIVPPLTSFFPLPEHRFTMGVIRSLGKELNVPLFDLDQAFRARERKDGLVLQMSGRLYKRQELVKFQAGRPRSLLVVETEPVRPQHIADRIYSYLDQNNATQALSIDGSLPNAAGHRLVARILARGVLDMLGSKTPQKK